MSKEAQGGQRKVGVEAVLDLDRKVVPAIIKQGDKGGGRKWHWA